jgi:short-subunit dehydrogenase
VMAPGNSYAAKVIRQRILITGASTGLGAGMARQFAAKGCHLALCARRTDLLEGLKDTLSQQYPDINVAVAELDVNDHERVPEVFGALSNALGGIDRVIVNAGLGEGAPLGSGNPRVNTAIIETNLVAALVQTETALQMFRKIGSGHLVLMSSIIGVRGIPGTWAAYAASKAGLRSLGESLRAEFARGPIKVSVIEAGYIESGMNPKSGPKLLMVDSAIGVKALVAAIERERGRAAVPWWPWAPIVQLLKVVPLSVIRRFV